jgi:hypothetical protein
MKIDKTKSSKFKVTVSKNRGVKFSIDHQTFTLEVLDDPEQPKMERYRWFAKQLRVALKRLANGKAKIA